MIKQDIVAFHNQTLHDHNFNKICIPQKMFFGRQCASRIIGEKQSIGCKKTPQSKTFYIVISSKTHFCLTFASKKNVKMYLIIFILSCILNIVLLVLYIHSRNSYHLLMRKNLQKESKADMLVDQVTLDSAVSDNDKEQKLIQTLRELMEQQQLYLDTELNIHKLAKAAGTNKNTLSHTINKCFDMNFASFINSYRIREAIRLLDNTEYRNYKIEAIGEMCGFGNRQAFHSAFKKEMGITPTHFRNISKNMAK
jgi:AraC-like DNA-binding protein